MVSASIRRTHSTVSTSQTSTENGWTIDATAVEWLKMSSGGLMLKILRLVVTEQSDSYLAQFLV